MRNLKKKCVIVQPCSVRLQKCRKWKKRKFDKSEKEDYNIIIDAGWSSLEARRAHNPKVAGSNPAPAIFLCNEKCGLQNIGVKNMLAYSLTDRF